MTKDKKFYYENLSYIILVCLGFLIVRLFFNSVVSRANVQYQQTIDDYLHHQKQLLAGGNRQDKAISNGLSDFETIEFWAKASKPKNSATDTWNPDSKNHRPSYQKNDKSSSGTNYFPTAVNVGNIEQQKNFKEIALSHGINEEKAKFKQHLLQKNKVSDLKNDENKTNTIVADEDQIIGNVDDIDLHSNFERLSPRVDAPLQIKPLNYIELEELTEFQIDDFKIEEVLFDNDNSLADENYVAVFGKEQLDRFKAEEEFIKRRKAEEKAKLEVIEIDDSNGESNGHSSNGIQNGHVTEVIAID